VTEPTFSLQDRLALRPVEAARVLGVSERKLRELLPELPHVRRGGVVLIPVGPLREWLREQVVQAKGRVEAAVEETMRALTEDND
jgi:excisionase family DNA binding protein